MPNTCALEKLITRFTPRRFGGRQHMPGAQHVDRHDLLRAPGAVVGQRRQVHDRRITPGRPAYRRQVQDIRPAGPVKPGHPYPACRKKPATGTPTVPLSAVTRTRTRP
jgi:hypothetical protein